MKAMKKRINALRKAIDEGVKSGFVDNFNPDEYLKKLKSKRKIKGT